MTTIPTLAPMLREARAPIRRQPARMVSTGTDPGREQAAEAVAGALHVAPSPTAAGEGLADRSLGGRQGLERAATGGSEGAEAEEQETGDET